MTPFDATVRIVNDGFLRPSAELSRELVDSNGFQQLPIEGLPVSVQFVRVVVQLTSLEPREHLVLWVHYPRLDDATLALSARAIWGAFPGMPATFVRDVTLTPLGERVEVDMEASSLQQRGTREGIAAVCAAQCWGVLADVERITLRLDGAAYLVRMRAEPPAWRALVASLGDASG